jgi:putative Holliday junction resolvase
MSRAGGSRSTDRVAGRCNDGQNGVMSNAPAEQLSVQQLAALLPAKGALMGLDLGTKTIGLSISDIGRSIASPLRTIQRSKFTTDARELIAEAEKHQVAALVLGLPLNMDGSEGPRVQATRAFARSLAPLTPLPILFWDERLSTAAVTRTLIAADASRKRRDEVVDKMAAAYILQGALDRMAKL